MKQELAIANQVLDEIHTQNNKKSKQNGQLLAIIADFQKLKKEVKEETDNMERAKMETRKETDKNQRGVARGTHNATKPPRRC